MSRIQIALQNDVKALELLRDELRLQAHLFRADARTRWQELEVRWDDLREHLGRAQVAAANVETDVNKAAKDLIGSLKKGYADFRNAFKH